MPAFDISPLHIFYGSLAIAVVMVAEALYLLFHDKTNHRDKVNRRLTAMKGEPNREKVMLELRRERGLNADGGRVLSTAWLNDLITHSGLRVGIGKVFAIMVGLALAGAVGAYLGTGSWKLALAASLGAGLAFPVFALRWLRGRRLRTFGTQFPEALDIIVRSLRAGHPVPVALSMVAREMGDPIGSEIGMVFDEITYGNDLEAAFRSLYERVGHEDLPLFVTSIAIQSQTGGNLSELLNNLSSVIRERQKMRRKVKALAAEGKTSAIILGAAPFLVFGAINMLNPSFYGDIWHVPLTQTVFMGAGVWMFIGFIVMRNMINFRI
jgi:tight adherence protein B